MKMLRPLLEKLIVWNVVRKRESHREFLMIVESKAKIDGPQSHDLQGRYSGVHSTSSAGLSGIEQRQSDRFTDYKRALT